MTTATLIQAGWQPIATAPKDNKHPLLLARFNDDGSLQCWDHGGLWQQEQESWEMPQVYYYWASAEGIEEPSHWMYEPDWFANLSVPAPPQTPKAVPELSMTLMQTTRNKLHSLHQRYEDAELRPEIEDLANQLDSVLDRRTSSAQDMVAVPVDLLGAACGAIAKACNAPKVLEQLRRYTTGDLLYSSRVAVSDATINRLMDADRLQALFDLAGHWQDGSDAPVTLYRDDATRTAIVKVGAGPRSKLYYKERGGFRDAIDAAHGGDW